MITIKTLVVVAGLAFSQEKAQDLPNLEKFKELLANPGLVKSLTLIKSARKECRVPENLDGATIENRWFSTTRDVMDAKGQPIGTLEVGGGGRIYKVGSVTVASGQIVSSNSWKIIDCMGALIGVIEESPARENRVLVIKDASGSVIAVSDAIGFSQNEYVINGAKGPLAKISDDDSQINITGQTDPRLILMATAYNDWADWRDSAARDRMKDTPGRR
jgi:hypothetical protein